RPARAARSDEPDPGARRRRLDRDVPLPRALQAALRLGRPALRGQRKERVMALDVESRVEQAPPADATADIRLDRVTKRFQDVVAVDDLSLEIARGRFFALLGPAGCGT